MRLSLIIQGDIINMSRSALEYSLDEVFGGNGRLLAFYDFSGLSGRHMTSDFESQYTTIFENCDPAVNTGILSGRVTDSLRDSIAESKKFTTGIFLANNKANLSGSNIMVSGTTDIPFSKTSTLFDFEFNGEVSDGILFGSLEKTSTTFEGETYSGASGYNVGINDRGKLFYQGFGQNGDLIKTANSIDLSKRNVVSFSLGGNFLTIARYDLLNNQIQKEDFPINTSFISSNDEFYLGGSPQYFRGGPNGPSGEFKTTDISLSSFCFFSGYIPSSAMFSMASGVVGDYFSDEGTATTKQQITGYLQTTVFKTGITGYDYQDTGSIYLSTGRYMRTGSFGDAGTVASGEGDRYFRYSLFNESGINIFNKEEVGILHSANGSGYQYTPTGEDAFATLGLRNIDEAVTEYLYEEFGSSGTATAEVTLYSANILTGVLSEISGVIQTPQFQTVTASPATPTSGIRLGGSSSLFKKDYIYYLGQRFVGLGTYTHGYTGVYDSVMSTGTHQISGSYAKQYGTDTFNAFNLDVMGGRDGIFFYNRNLSSGHREVKLVSNGQTFFQERPLTTQTPNETVFSITTGDFFTKGNDAPIIERGKLFFADSTPHNPRDLMSFDVVTGGIFAGTGDFGLSLNSGISGQYQVSQFNDYDYFLNGIKVYSGDGVGIAVGVGTTQGWQVGFAVGQTAAGGVVTNHNKNNFKYTAYKKNPRTISVTGQSPEIFGTGFIEGRTKYYINGVNNPPENYLELYTGVNIIKRDLGCSISGGMTNLKSGDSLSL